MALSSMTGFARLDGVSGAYAWSWELKSVNSKGLDLRLRVPAGWDAVEAAARDRLKALARGAVYATLSVSREAAATTVRLNNEVLEAVLRTMNELAARVPASAVSLDGILGIKGVMEIGTPEETEAERSEVHDDLVHALDRALAALQAMRRHEGDALADILSVRLAEIEALTAKADAAPGRQAEAIKARLAEQVATLLDVDKRLDADRLHQEALLLATKVDIREELDRLGAHVAQARKLLREGGAVGRRLDFLAQEFNREVNTLCSKSNDVELTTIGLELKSIVEQFREQVQNLE